MHTHPRMQICLKDKEHFLLSLYSLQRKHWQLRSKADRRVLRCGGTRNATVGVALHLAWVSISSCASWQLMAIICFCLSCNASRHLKEKNQYSHTQGLSFIRRPLLPSPTWQRQINPFKTPFLHIIGYLERCSRLRTTSNKREGDDTEEEKENRRGRLQAMQYNFNMT